MLNLKERIAQGDSSTLQFKLQWSDNDKITKELVAFANSRGGSIVFGIEDKTGRIDGLTYEEVQSISSLAANMAENNIVPTLYINSHPEEIEGKTVLVVDVPSGSNKPYKTKKGGEIYVKQGADKRQVHENREILRMFYESGQYYPDQMGVKGTSVKNLSESLIDRFFHKQFGKGKEDFDVPVQNLYENLCLIDEKGQATLAGLLFFGVMPTWRCPQFKIKAVCFVGNDLAGTQYRDSVDIEGTVPEMYEQAMRFCEGNLRHLQDGQSFNSEGHLEVSRIALEELIQNALVHREMLGEDVIKILIFDNRIEIESPGCLPQELTVEKIKLGNAKIRNPQMSQFCAKTMPYRGLGSGITRAMKSGSRVELLNDIERDKFVATIWRENNAQVLADKAQISSDDTTQKGENTTQKGENTTQKSENTTQKSENTTQKNGDTTQKTFPKLTEMQLAILDYLREKPKASRKKMLEDIKGITEDGIKYNLKTFQEKGLLKRIGADKGGYWEVTIK